jgi:hypothetical protein
MRDPFCRVLLVTRWSSIEQTTSIARLSYSLQIVGAPQSLQVMFCCSSNQAMHGSKFSWIFVSVLLLCVNFASVPVELSSLVPSSISSSKFESCSLFVLDS